MIGGYAVILHGVDTRVTYDIDVVPDAEEDNLRRLGAALTELRARVITEWDPDTDELHVNRSDFQPRVFRDNPFLHLLTDVGRMDIHMAPAGCTRGYPDLRPNADEETVLGVRIRPASLDDLITMKEAVRRPRDEGDLQQLYQIRAVQLPEPGEAGRSGDSQP